MSGSTSTLSYANYESELAKLSMDDPCFGKKYDYLQIKYKEAIADYNASKGSTPPRTSSTPPPPPPPSHGKVWECFQQLILMRQHQIGQFQNMSDDELYSLAKEHLGKGFTVEEVRDQVRSEILQHQAKVLQQQQQQQLAKGGSATGGHASASIHFHANRGDSMSSPSGQDGNFYLSHSLQEMDRRGLPGFMKAQAIEARQFDACMQNESDQAFFAKMRQAKLGRQAQFDQNPLSGISYGTAGASSTPPIDATPLQQFFLNLVNQNGRKPAAGFGQ